MKSVIAALALLLSFSAASGQLSGKLTNAAGGPLPLANIMLLKSSDSSLVRASISDDQGNWHMAIASSGKFFVRISSTGYQTWSSASFELANANAALDLGTTALEQTSKELSAVVVRAERPIFQQLPEGMTVNVAASPLTKGSTALAVLERSPGVIIDRRNNDISLNGKNGVTVMINGKLMRLPADQLVNMLNGMSADNIEKIELLTTPPSKYDAEGSAGIINIVLKKNLQQGTNGSYSLTAGYGWHEKAGATASIAHRGAGIDWNLAYNYLHDRTGSFFFNEGSQDIPVLGGPMTFQYGNNATGIRNSHDLTAGIDIRTGSRTTIGASLNASHSKYDLTTDNWGGYKILPDSLLSYKGHIRGDNRWRNLLASVYIERILRKGEKITATLDGLYYNNRNPADLSSTFLDPSGQPAKRPDSLFAPQQKDYASTSIKVGVLRIDYTRQLNEKIRLEAGIKGTYTKDGSSSGIQSLINGSWTASPETSNDIDMRESIAAAYATTSIQLTPTIILTAGARYEYARSRLRNNNTGKYDVDRRLGVIFPTIFLSKKLSDHSELQLSYNKRISRPSYNDLASFVGSNDPVAVFTGNPLLKPTLTNNLKLGYTWRSNAFSVRFSRDDNPIARWQLTSNPAGTLLYVAPQNMKYLEGITLQSTTPWKVNEWWNMNLNLIGYWNRFSLDWTKKPVTSSYAAYTISANQTFKAPHGWTFELSGWINSKWYSGSQKGDGMGSLNAGIKKELSNNKGAFLLSVTDILQTTLIRGYYGHVTEEVFSGKSYYDYNGESMKFPIVKLTYTRSFGTGERKASPGQGASDERERVNIR